MVKHILPIDCLNQITKTSLITNKHKGCPNIRSERTIVIQTKTAEWGLGSFHTSNNKKEFSDKIMGGHH
ncbi:hypothetical protein DVK85_06250 [Flavobacterium arcticum]|uniref:Uncharacterized protein n=1 Tax=Flavobacterium arcticum TaxID=1784713 RepID=A0A345HBA1_9FLAO|nr:hypothetical protein [Flavobacterium arcticum]AXG73861.1 hypothetical protein DVK85_06250 [Flavobacterium arcticum]KAF2511814.1 hypothetical protein E0W72_05770 [Flavobacterium arcticum]